MASYSTMNTRVQSSKRRDVLNTLTVPKKKAFLDPNVAPSTSLRVFEDPESSSEGTTTCFSTSSSSLGPQSSSSTTSSSSSFVKKALNLQRFETTLASIPAYVADLSVFDDDGMAAYVRQFRLVERISNSKQYSSYQDFTTARRRCNVARNRYCNVLATEKTRVKVRVAPDSDYINANYVQRVNGGRFICTQAPLSTTFNDFWTMIFEQNVSLISMLTREIEGNVVKCRHYWPTVEMDSDTEDSSSTDFDVTDGSVMYIHTESGRTLDLRLLSCTQKETHVERQMLLRDIDSQETHAILHLQYVSWPDFGVPSNVEDFLTYMKAVREPVWQDHPLQPENLMFCDRDDIVVHCSAGLGRTGAFMLIDALLSQHRTHTQEQHAENTSPTYNIIRTLLQIRTQRVGAVQTSEQFLFCHVALLCSLRPNSVKKTYYHANVDCEERAEALLVHRKEGAFLIRRTRKVRILAISYVFDRCVRHWFMKVCRTDNGPQYQLLDGGPLFESLEVLCEHFGDVLRHPCNRLVLTQL